MSSPSLSPSPSLSISSVNPSSSSTSSSSSSPPILSLESRLLDLTSKCKFYESEILRFSTENSHLKLFVSQLTSKCQSLESHNVSLQNQLISLQKERNISIPLNSPPSYSSNPSSSNSNSYDLLSEDEISPPSKTSETMGKSFKGKSPMPLIHSSSAPSATTSSSASSQSSFSTPSAASSSTYKMMYEGDFREGKTPSSSMYYASLSDQDFTTTKSVGSSSTSQQSTHHHHHHDGKRRDSSSHASLHGQLSSSPPSSSTSLSSPSPSHSYTAPSLHSSPLPSTPPSLSPSLSSSSSSSSPSDKSLLLESLDCWFPDVFSKDQVADLLSPCPIGSYLLRPPSESGNSNAFVLQYVQNDKKILKTKFYRIVEAQANPPLVGFGFHPYDSKDKDGNGNRSLRDNLYGTFGDLVKVQIGDHAKPIQNPNKSKTKTQ